MCYNVQSLLESQLKLAVRKRDFGAIAEIKEKLAVYGVENYYHTSGFQHKPFLILMEHDAEVASWGLIPNWINSEEDVLSIQNKTINARSETLSEKASFHKAFETGRAVLAIDGFFDFKKDSDKTTPFFLQSKKKNPLNVACVSDLWLNEKTGEMERTFSIVTKKGNGIIESIHQKKEPRLPVLLDENGIDTWLEHATFETEELELDLIAHQVRPLSGNQSKGNVPEVTDEVVDQADDQMTLF